MLTFVLDQAGSYNPKVLNQESTKEPFPVRCTVRNKHYEKLIFATAEREGVLEDAKASREE